MNLKSSASAFIAMVTLIITFNLNAQNPPRQELYKITQVPPNAAALGKYGEYGVGYYSGVPDISIPLYELSSDRINIPLNLSYHSGGIKVEEIASSVGLGWSLNAGGVITRSIKGLPDEDIFDGGDSFLEPTTTIDDFAGSSSSGGTAFNTKVKKMIANQIDGQPDIFYFNFGNKSGKFVYNQTDHQFYTIPYSKLKIEFDSSQGKKSFKLTDELGLVYTFEDTETSTREGQEGFGPVVVTTSWYLTSIEDPISNGAINFSYADYSINYETVSSETHYMPITLITESDSYYSNKQSSILQLKRLAQIVDRSSIVNFTYGTARCDLPGDFALTKISISSPLTGTFKEYKLNYDYFITDQHSAGNCSSKEESLFKRLKLLSLEDNPPGFTGISTNIHSFEYDLTNLPSRLSKAQDYWGFYNGANSNQFLFPPYNYVNANYTTILPGGNRQVNPIFTKAASLKKITYPTSGYTSFEFEGNTAVSTQVTLPTPTNNKQVSLSLAGTNYQESEPFNVLSSACVENNGQLGSYISLNASNINEAAIIMGGYPGISAQIKLRNTVTNEELIFYQKGGGKDISSMTYMPISYFLPNGDYVLIIDCSENPIPESYMEAHASMSWSECLPPNDVVGSNRLVGGLRISKITNYSATNEIANIKSYSYGQESNPSLTSGQTHYRPKFVNKVMFKENFDGGGGGGENALSLFLKRTSSSNYPLVSENGKSVGYTDVTEMDGINGANGYTQYKFTNYTDYDDTYLTHSDAPISQQWLRGLEKSKTVYKRVNGQDQLVLKTVNDYATDLLGTAKKISNGIAGEFIYNVTDVPIDLPGEDMVLLGAVAAGWEVQPTYSDFVYLKSTKEQTYIGSSIVENIKTNIYNINTLEASEVKTLGSDGVATISTTHYPLDFAVNNAIHPKAISIKNLQDLNYIRQPIEQYTEKQVGGGAKKLVGASYFSFQTLEPLIDTVFSMNLPAIGITAYPGISITNSTFSKDVSYEPNVIAEGYANITNRLLQQKKFNGVSRSYIWDYSDQYVVAEAIGASSREIAYTSFEADGKGNWIYSGSNVPDANAVTGRSKYLLTPAKPLQANGLSSSKSYLITYWAQGPGSESISGGIANILSTLNGWTCYSRIVTGVTSITLSGSIGLDEVRLCPKDALMTTYVFNSPAGMTSQTDPKLVTTFYEYDEYQRLKRIKDQNGNIVKSMDYHYKP